MKVCDRCKGRGIVYRRDRSRRTCPECSGRTVGTRAEVLNGLDSCWDAYLKGATGEFNLELAVRRCLGAGLLLGELSGRGIPAKVFDRAAKGQGQLL